MPLHLGPFVRCRLGATLVMPWLLFASFTCIGKLNGHLFVAVTQFTFISFEICI